MVAKMGERRSWHDELAAFIRAGHFEFAAVTAFRGVHLVVGIGLDGVPSRPFAKYGDARRAQDAVLLVHRLAGVNREESMMN
jgi:hypothetical protein